MKIKTAHELIEIESALREEMKYCNENNIPLSDGGIGIEALSSDSGYAYASKGGYGNMGNYIPYNVAFSAVRKYIHLKG